MRAAYRIAATAAGVAIVGIAAFVAAYTLRGPDEVTTASGSPERPSKEVTPEPGATPDTAAPFWHIPYVKQDEQKPPFSGEFNGYQIAPGGEGKVERTAYDLCPGVGLDAAAPDKLLATVTAPGPLRIDPQSLPVGVRSRDLPGAFLCHGELALAYWLFHAEAGTVDVNPGGSPLSINRIRGQEPVIHSAPEDRWVAVTIGGLPAVVARPIVTVGDEQFGACFAAVYNPDSDVFTTVSAHAANAEFCIAVMAAVVS